MVSSKDEYVPVAPDDNLEGLGQAPRRSSCLGDSLKTAALVVGCLVIGFVAGHGWTGIQRILFHSKSTNNELLDPQDFIPPIPIVPVTFTFPTPYEATTPEADTLWSELMPLGAGFLRIPSPRRFAMPPSKTIPNDTSSSEIYSLSITHQIHCLAILRDVIIKYEKHDKSRFASGGHEYHCLDYIRQAILCAGDTTLDFAELVRDADGEERRLGFTGDGSRHMCRSWEAIKEFAVAKRHGDKTGVI